MKIFKSLIPEITYLTGVMILFLTMWHIMGLSYAMFFLGATLLIVSGYLSNVMNVEVE